MFRMDFLMRKYLGLALLVALASGCGHKSTGADHFASNTYTTTFTWTPTYSQAGTYTVTYKACTPGCSATQSYTRTITVNNENRAPVLDAIGNKSVDEGAPLTFIISATDPDGDTITYSASNLPTGGPEK